MGYKFAFQFLKICIYIHCLIFTIAVARKKEPRLTRRKRSSVFSMGNDIEKQLPVINKGN